MKSFQNFSYNILEAEAKVKPNVNVIAPEILPMQPEEEPTTGTKKAVKNRKKGPVRPSTIEKAFKSALEKGYRTPSGQITPKGIQTYYQRRKTQGYGDPGKSLKGGPEALKKASELTTNITPEKKKIIKGVVKNIETKYPTPESVKKSTSLGFRQFSQSIGTGAGLRAQAASDAAKDMAAEPQRQAQQAAQRSAKRAAGFADLQKKIDNSRITGDVTTPSSTSKVTTNLTTDPGRVARQAEKEVAKKVAKSGILAKSLKVAGPIGAAVEGGLSYKQERAKGSGRLRSAGAAGASVAGGTLGGIVGGAVAGPVGGLIGYGLGSYGGQKAFDVAAGANAKERAAMAQINRQRQAGKAIVGTGGRTTFSSKGKDMFISTGAPGARKTVQLAKTSVVKDPITGKSEVGYLAKQGGQAVYKRGADPSTLAKTSTNWLERVGRTIAPGAYTQHDIKQTQSKLAAAQKSDAATKAKLGIK